MADRFTNRPGFLAVTVGGLLMTGQLVTAPPAQGCPAGQVEDTVTRMCWSQSGQGDTYGGAGGGPCLPGRLGNCVGTLQNASPAPAAQLLHFAAFRTAQDVSGVVKAVAVAYIPTH